jgi:hypothetical protein
MVMEYPMKVSTQRKVSFPQRKEEWEGVEIKRRKWETKNNQLFIIYMWRKQTKFFWTLASFIHV